jgi:hypothetical protein
VVAEGATEAVGGSNGSFMDFLTGVGDGLVGREFVTSDTVCIGERALETVLTRNTRGFAKLVFVGCANGTGRRIA